MAGKGLKSGASPIDWDETDGETDSVDDPDADADVDGTTTAASTDLTLTSEPAPSTADDGGVEATAAPAAPSSAGAAGGHVDELPYIARRNVLGKSISFERSTRVEIFLQDDTVAREDDWLAELEAALGEDVNKLDAREAALLYAFENPEGVAATLREMGVNYYDQ